MPFRTGRTVNEPCPAGNVKIEDVLVITLSIWLKKSPGRMMKCQLAASGRLQQSTKNTEGMARS